MRNSDIGNDQSMEDILASIRKMISEDPPGAAISAKPSAAPASAASEPEALASPVPAAAPDAEDDLSDLLTGDSSPTPATPAAPIMPTTGFMAPAAKKPSWGLRRDGFIPPSGADLSATAGPQQDPAPVPLTSPAPSPAPTAGPSDFGAIVPGVFGRRDPAPSSPFPKPPLRLTPEPSRANGRGEPLAGVTSGLTAGGPFDDVAKGATALEPAAPVSNVETPESHNSFGKARTLNGDAELAALVGKVFERREPAAAEPTAAPVPLKVSDQPRFSPLPPRQEPVFDQPAPTPAKTAAVSMDTIGGPALSRTLEDVVGELLRPMLKTWLDANMPRMLEAALRKEAGFGGRLDDGDSTRDKI